MTHHEDSMCLPATPRRNHNRRPVTVLGNMGHQVPLSDSDNRTFPRRRLPVQVGRARIRKHIMASSKARPTLDLACNPMLCMARTCHLRNRNDSLHNNIHTMVETSCTIWRSHRHHKHHNPRTTHSTDKDQIQQPRHWPPNSACHNRHNTTLQDRPVRPARRRLTILPILFPRNIITQKLTRNPDRLRNSLTPVR